MHKEQKTPNSPVITYFLVSISVIMFILGAVGVIEGISKTKRASKLPVATETITQNITEPEESKSDYSNYIAPNDQPRFINIPDVGINAPIQKVGLTQDNIIVAPTNINFAGWFVDSPKPGDTGVSIINGHVSGKYAKGVFSQLYELESGQQFNIEFGDGTRKYFEVIESKKLLAEETSEYMLDQIDGISNQLNLVTCDGDFNDSTQQYSHRLVVASKLLD